MSKKGRKRLAKRLRAELELKVGALCELSKVGLVTFGEEDWRPRFNSKGEHRPLKTDRPWLDMPVDTLEMLLRLELRPLNPKSPLERLAECAE